MSDSLQLKVQYEENERENAATAREDPIAEDTTETSSPPEDESYSRWLTHHSEGLRLLQKQYSSSAIAELIHSASFIGNIKDQTLRRHCEAELFCNLGKGYADIFEKDKSVECFNHSINVARDLGDETLERVAQNAKCDAYADFTSGPTVEGASVD